MTSWPGERESQKPCLKSPTRTVSDRGPKAWTFSTVLSRSVGPVAEGRGERESQKPCIKSSTRTVRERGPKAWRFSCVLCRSASPLAIRSGIPGLVPGLGGLALCHFIVVVVVGEGEALPFLGPIPSVLGSDSLGMPGPIALFPGGFSLGMPGPIPSFLGGDSLGMSGPIALSLGGDSLGMPGPVPSVDDPSPRPSLGFFSPELCEFVGAVVTVVTVVVGGIRRGGEFTVFTVVVWRRTSGGALDAWHQERAAGLVGA